MRRASRYAQAEIAWTRSSPGFYRRTGVGSAAAIACGNQRSRGEFGVVFRVEHLHERAFVQRGLPGHHHFGADADTFQHLDAAAVFMAGADRRTMGLAIL